MKELQMPASYGRIPEAEQFQIVGGQFDCYKLATKETDLTNFLERRCYWHKDGCRNLHLVTSVGNPLSMVSG